MDMNRAAESVEALRRKMVIAGMAGLHGEDAKPELEELDATIGADDKDAVRGEVSDDSRQDGAPRR